MILRVWKWKECLIIEFNIKMEKKIFKLEDEKREKIFTGKCKYNARKL